MSSIDQLRDLLDRRIVVLDGAMGTMVQGLELDEAAWRGEQLRNHGTSVKGCNDLLALTRPEAIETIHLAFLRAGADIVETDTFGGTPIVLAEYGLQQLAREINLRAAKLGRHRAARPSRPPGRDVSSGGSWLRAATPRRSRWWKAAPTSC
jgi:5-methyltetrahydrofolate--homocysteine methyltransferase